jgi:hypothetical protein
MGRVGRPMGRDAVGVDGGPDVVRAAATGADVTAGVVRGLRVGGGDRRRREGRDCEHAGGAEPAELAEQADAAAATRSGCDGHFSGPRVAGWLRHQSRYSREPLPRRLRHPATRRSTRLGPSGGVESTEVHRTQPRPAVSVALDQRTGPGAHGTSGCELGVDRQLPIRLLSRWPSQAAEERPRRPAREPFLRPLSRWPSQAAGDRPRRPAREPFLRPFVTLAEPGGGERPNHGPEQFRTQRTRRPQARDAPSGSRGPRVGFDGGPPTGRSDDHSSSRLAPDPRSASRGDSVGGPARAPGSRTRCRGRGRPWRGAGASG